MKMPSISRRKPNTNLCVRHPISRRKSNTTLVGIVYEDWFLVGSDSRVTCPSYGRVLNDQCNKMIPVYENMIEDNNNIEATILWSGNGDFIRKLIQALTADLMKERPTPTGIAEIASVVVQWVNYFTEINNFNVNLLVVGAVGREKFKAFNIRPDPNLSKTYRSWEHKLFFVKKNSIIIGSGQSHARKIITDKDVTDLVLKDEVDRVKLVFKGLQEAADNDWGTGGQFNLAYQVRGAPVRKHFKSLHPAGRVYIKPLDPNAPPNPPAPALDPPPN